MLSSYPTDEIKCLYYITLLEGYRIRFSISSSVAYIQYKLWHRGPKPVACRFWLFLFNHILHCICLIRFTESKYLVSNWSYTRL